MGQFAEAYWSSDSSVNTAESKRSTGYQEIKWTKNKQFFNTRDINQEFKQRE